MEALLVKAMRSSAAVIAARSPFFTTPTSTLSTVPKQNAAPSKRPQWLQAVFYDKRTYFEDVDHVERCFLTDVTQDANRKCFSFSFKNAPKPEYQRIDTSYLALRESCRCEKCFSSDPQQRLHSLIDLNLTESPAHVNFDRDQQLLHVSWSTNDHKSVYSGPWLYSTFTPHPLFEKPKEKLWTVDEYRRNFQSFDFEEICRQPESMIRCLHGLATYGLVKLTKAPAAPGALSTLSRYMNYIKKTHYGEVFQVENKPTVTNIAYAYGKLTQHIDLPYFDYMPGLQFLHCIRQSKNGGESTFADSFAVVEFLRHNHKDVFEILSQTPVYAYNYTTDISDAFLVQKVAPIVLAPDGSVKRVVYSNPTFDSYRHLTPERQIAFCNALQFFMKTLERPEYRLRFKLKEGEIAVFNNIRVTHGREAFDPSEFRFLEGCYMDWDEIYSRLRLLQSQVFRKKLAERWPDN